MTEAEWNDCTDPDAMLVFLRASDRQYRLFAAACFHRVEHLRTDESSPVVRSCITTARRRLRGAEFGFGETQEAARKVASCAVGAVEYAALAWGGPAQALAEQERFVQALLLRDIVGVPHRPLPAIDPRWLTWGDGVVLKLARTISEGGTFDVLPILADALEEAGCPPGELLEHLRAPALHAPGCWALDLLLGR